jgi:hypothetical protein
MARDFWAGSGLIAGPWLTALGGPTAQWCTIRLAGDSGLLASRPSGRPHGTAQRAVEILCGGLQGGGKFGRFHTIGFPPHGNTGLMMKFCGGQSPFCHGFVAERYFRGGVLKAGGGSGHFRNRSKSKYNNK